jgi:hypothetical protein
MLPRSARIGAAALSAALLVSGCGGPGFLGTRRPVQALPVETDEAVLNPVLATLQLMADLPGRDPGRQAELFQAAKDAAELTPTTSNRLKFALVLATPGHAGSDPVAAQRQLAELLATPETLLPIERYLAQSELRQVERQLILSAENGRLRDEAPREAHDKLAASNRRLSAETDENAKLRKELDEARSKLDAISHIERSINDRSTSVTGASAK